MDCGKNYDKFFCFAIIFCFVFCDDALLSLSFSPVIFPFLLLLLLLFAIVPIVCFFLPTSLCIFHRRLFSFLDSNCAHFPFNLLLFRSRNLIPIWVNNASSSASSSKATIILCDGIYIYYIHRQNFFLFFLLFLAFTVVAVFIIVWWLLLLLQHIIFYFKRWINNFSQSPRTLCLYFVLFFSSFFALCHIARCRCLSSSLFYYVILWSAIFCFVLFLQIMV